MSSKVTPAITALFSGPEPVRTPVIFSWRLVRRRGRPFLLLPGNSRRAAHDLELYLAQRPLAKLCRSLIPVILSTPAARIFEPVSIAADADANWMRFLTRQAGLEDGALATPVIKFGGVAGKTSRLILLLHDAGGHPIRVVKAGLDPAGRALTTREADLLSRLPAGVIGCTGISGRFSSETVSAFATTYFPGASLDNDVGIEKLFRCWLNELPLVSLESLASWHELESMAHAADIPEWAWLRDALAGQKVRTTLFHGDFTPWNVRMENLETIQAFDWERGHLHGIPAWDWFHFIVQTSILVKRHSRERIAAELEQLFQSPRFQNYAAEAGISHCFEPLLLAYLLHQRLVVQPEEGRERTRRLFQLLWQQWRMKQVVGELPVRPAARARRSPTEQLKSAGRKFANLLWEPSLSPEWHPPLLQQCGRHWRGMLAALLWIGGVAAIHYFVKPHIMLAPFYLAPCIWLALVAGRPPALLVAIVAGLAGPEMQYFKEPGVMGWPTLIWNVVMRILVFQFVVVLLHHARQTHLYRPPPSRGAPPGGRLLADNWLVVLVMLVYLGLLALLNIWVSPHGNFILFYLVPGVLVALVTDVRWGTVAAVLAAAAAALAQHFGDPGDYTWPATGWNGLMRLAIFETTVLLVRRVHQENILFSDLKVD